MSKAKVQQWQAPQRFVLVDTEATKGATIGTNLYWSDGAAVTEAELRQATAAPAPSVSRTMWSLVLSIPPNVTALQNATGTGLFAVTGAGTGALRTLGDSANIAWTNGDGVAGDPVPDLTDLTDAGGGTLQKTAFDAKGRKTGTSAATTSDLTEGSNLYYTAARVRAALLVGLSTASSAVITAADTVLGAFGKLQAQITALTSRTISTTAPLTGGGDLSANRTLAISAATTVAAGSMSAADKAKLDGIGTAAKVQSVVAGTNVTVDATDPANPIVSASGGGGSGTVTSVGMTVPAGFAITGSPVTTAGTLAVAYDTGYQGYTTAESTKLAGIASGATAYTDTNARAAVIATAITNGDTTHAPSGDAVFDALALKADATSIPTYGSYTPTGSGVTNVTSVTGQPCNWFRHGNTVFLDGRVDANPTAAGACVAFVSVPVASNFGAFTDAAGILVVAGTSITKASGTIIASIADDGFRFNFDGQGTGQHQLYFHASYTVI